MRPVTPLRPLLGGKDPSSPSSEHVDPEDMEQLFRRFAPYVARIAGRILGRWGEVDDIVQDVFLDAHLGLKALRDAAAVRHWLATVTVRKARRRLGRRGVMRWLGLDASFDGSQIPDANASAETRAYVIAVYRILDTVSPDARVAWLMHRVEDESLETVATICKCSRATAHRRVCEAQLALEKGFQDDPKR